MNFEAAFDTDTFGLALFWNAPMRNIECLNQHTIILIIFNLRIGVSW